MSIANETHAAALIVAPPTLGRLGHARSLLDKLGSATVLEHTLQRAARIEGIQHIVLLAGTDITWLELIRLDRFPLEIKVIPHGDLDHAAGLKRRAAAWATTAWRGGLGGATAWDELLPADALHHACETLGITSAVVLGGDWCAIDPVMTSAVLKLHTDAPQVKKLCFAQAPPGLCGVAIAATTLAEMTRAKTHTGFARALAYNPQAPTVDPVSKEACLRISPAVRDLARRFIYDTDEATARLHQLADTLGPAFDIADADAITQATRTLERTQPDTLFNHLPPAGVLIELTPRRNATGPITPQHHLTFNRPDMQRDTIDALAPQCHGIPVVLGGVGDALLHADWRHAVKTLQNDRVSALAVETDLLGGAADADALIEANVDVVIVRINADTGATYRKVMGIDAYETVLKGIERLLNHALAHPDTAPRVVPRLTKVADNTAEMETFFERWWQLAGHAHIERFSTVGTGTHALLEDQSPVPMNGPWRTPDPHQRKQRLTVLSNAELVLCSHDILGRASLGNASQRPLLKLWQDVATLADDAMQAGWTPDDSPMCRRCFDWLSLRASQTPALMEVA